MRTRPIAALAVATALGLAACGGGGGKKATTTSSSTSLDAASTEPSSTSTTIDQSLSSLLLVAADMPGYTEKPDSTGGSSDGGAKTSCDATTAPAFKAATDAPSADGATFTKGAAPSTVTASSNAISLGADEAQKVMAELLEPKVQQCLETDLKGALNEGVSSNGGTATLKLTSTKSKVTGAEETVLVDATGTITGNKGTLTLRLDLVFLRKAGIIVIVSYFAPGSAAAVTERQRIVGILGKRLGGPDSGTTAGSSTSSSVGGSTTTRKSTTTTKRSSTTSTTKKASTTSSTA